MLSKSVLLAILLGASELLALIPKVKSNSLVTLVYQGGKWLYKKIFKK